MKTKLLESLDRKIGREFTVRRYSLADMLSESYKVYYECKEGSNLKKIAEAHLNDVRNNPRDIENLSRQLCIIKELRSLTESGDIKDSELVEKRKVSPKRRFTESAEPTHTRYRAKSRLSGEDSSLNELDDPELTDDELEELAKHLEAIRKEKKTSTPPTNREESAANKETTNDNDDEETPKQESVDPGKEEELREKDIANRRVWQLGVDIFCPESKMDSVKSAVTNAIADVGPDCSVSGIMWTDTSWTAEEYGLKEAVEDFDTTKGKSELVDKDSKDTIDGNKERVMVRSEYCTESLKDFSKHSKDKAFMKTMKKLDTKLHEGAALTRQESISLYKAANSALTQLTIELEHNPRFLKAFRESTSILSNDVNSLLESIKRDKAPSKKTMKSLAKFSESLLNESNEYPDVPGFVSFQAYKNMCNDKGLTQYTEDEMYDMYLDDCESDDMDESKNSFKKYWDDLDKEERKQSIEYYKGANDEERQHLATNAKEEFGVSPEDFHKFMSNISESESAVDEAKDNEDVDDEAKDNEDVDDEAKDNEDVDDVPEEELSDEEDFDQEYADARVELHKELVANHGDDESPEIKEKIDKDTEEVKTLPGITDEQLAELQGDTSDEVPEESDEEVSEESDEEEEEISDDITDDELEELKSHLKEMRSAKRTK